MSGAGRDPSKERTRTWLWQQMDGQEDRWSAPGLDGPQLPSGLPSMDLKEDTGRSWIFLELRFG